MEDPQAILSLARQRSVPSTWRVFTKKRGVTKGFFGRTLHDPDPLLVFTPEGVIEYINERKPLSIIKFADLSEVRLRVSGVNASSDDIKEPMWLDLYLLNEKHGAHKQWHSSSFKDNVPVFQYFIEAYALYKALHRKP
jgi:hypothetical protein